MRIGRPLSRTGLTLSLRKTPFICPTCAFAQASSASPAKLPFKLSSRRKRHASTVASATAINASKEIPARLKALHDSLTKLRKDAASFINISRLQLAIRSLESGRPTIRLAVLGLPNQQVARRVARLLLADPLGEEGQWEKKLDAFEGGGDDDDDRGLLLRYSEETDPTPPSPADTALYIPSRVLQRHNLEVLVSSFNLSSEMPVDSSAPAEFRRAALIPTAESPSSFSGGVSFLTYPVHRALIVAQGLHGCLTLGKYISPGGASPKEQDVTLKLASNFPELAGELQENTGQDQTEVSIIDIAKATNAIDKLRESISNSSTYEQLWNASGLPGLEKWLLQGFLQEENKGLDPAIQATIDDVLQEASRTIAAEEDVAQALAASDPVASDVVRQSFDEELKAWAMRAHMELRDRLDSAFSGDKWAKLSWWKLVWRTDDVSMITNELLESSWLVDAEKSIIWLSGRSVEAGIPAKPGASTLKLPEESQSHDIDTQAPSTTPNGNDPLPTPWPTQIPAARVALEKALVPPMQSLSQALLLQTMSVSGLTSALSVLIYISFPSVSIYSAAAVGTLGVAWSLRRLQKIWERAREDWQQEVRERGRVVLKDVEQQFRNTVLDRKTRQAEGDLEDQYGLVDAGARDRRVARQAVEGVRSSLDQINSGESSSRGMRE